MNMTDVNIDASKNFILFRSDVKCSENSRVVQMSKDVLEICGNALEKENLLGEDSQWFWESCGLIEKHLKKFKV
jgi:hypothetical protein